MAGRALQCVTNREQPREPLTLHHLHHHHPPCLSQYTGIAPKANFNIGANPTHIVS